MLISTNELFCLQKALGNLLLRELHSIDIKQTCSLSLRTNGKLNMEMIQFNNSLLFIFVQ